MNDYSQIVKKFKARCQKATISTPTKPIKKQKKTDKQYLAFMNLKQKFADFTIHDYHSDANELLICLENYPTLAAIPEHWEYDSFVPHESQFVIPPSLQRHCAPRIAELQRLNDQTQRQMAVQEVKVQKNQQLVDKEQIASCLLKMSEKVNLLPFGELYVGGFQDLRYLYQFERGVLSDRLKEAIGFENSGKYLWVSRMDKLQLKPQ